MSRRRSTFAVIRWALLMLLVVGLCLQPVLAASCELGDALGKTAGVQVDAAGHAGGEADGCCPSQACSDCCAHATASLEQPAIVAFASLRLAQRMQPMHGCITRDYPVDIRPPIYV